MITIADYILYGDSCGINQRDMVEVIATKYPFFTKVQMSMASNPERNALQLIPAAEEMLATKFGAGPGLSISPKLSHRRNHGNGSKPNRLYVRVNDQLRSQLQAIYEKMCFASMQDLLEAALGDFVRKYGEGVVCR